MSLNPKELEDDIVREQNELRKNPTSFIVDLEKLSANTYKNDLLRNVLIDSIGETNIQSAIDDSIKFLTNQRPIGALKNSTCLESSAKDYFSVADPDNRLNERLEKYTSWTGEINEIVHYTNEGATGKDVILGILLTDPSACKDIIFNPDFNYFGVRVGKNDDGGFCAILDYANNVGTQTNPWSEMRSNIERNNQKPSLYDYNIVRTTRNYSRRDIKYDHAVETLVNVPKYRNKYSLEYSPSSKEDVIISRYPE